MTMFLLAENWRSALRKGRSGDREAEEDTKHMDFAERQA